MIRPQDTDQRRSSSWTHLLAPYTSQTSPPASQRLANNSMPLRRTPSPEIPRQNGSPCRIRKDSNHLLRPHAGIPLASHRRQIPIQPTPHSSEITQDHSLSRYRRLSHLAYQIHRLPIPGSASQRPPRKERHSSRP